VKVPVNLVDHQRSFKEVQRRQNLALYQSEFLCEADGLVGTRSNLVENRWYCGGHSFEREVDGFVGVKSPKKRPPSKSKSVKASLSLSRSM
jgi:hypothetical protein